MANPNTIPYLHYQDLQISDESLRNQFMVFLSNEQYSKAAQLLVDNADTLSGKAFVAESINIITRGVLTLENLFDTDVIVYLTNLADKMQATVDSLRNMNEWRDNIKYTPFNFVSYNNKVYMSIKDSTGILPTNKTYWVEYDIQGITGAPGVNVEYVGKWSNAVDYKAFDLVTYQDSMYVAKQSSKSIAPTNADYWQVFLTTDKAEITIGHTAPTKYKQDTVWIYTEEDLVTTTKESVTAEYRRYNAATNSWESMYPGVLYREVQNYEQLVVQSHSAVVDVAFNGGETITTDINFSGFGFTVPANYNCLIMPYSLGTDAALGISIYSQMTAEFKADKITLSLPNNMIESGKQFSGKLKLDFTWTEGIS